MSDTKSPPPYPGLVEFLFNSPLYAKFQLADDLNEVRELYGRVETFGLGSDDGHARIDGFCPSCGKESTFLVNGISIPSGDPWARIKTRHAFEGFDITCLREDFHKIRYFVRIRKMVIEKVGQSPSLADIAIEETRKKYKSVLKGESWGELYKAIGLAAHGEGIGSFVYLRRVFERLIKSRFEQFKGEEGWKDDDFTRLRMDEKIAFLKDHLPPFLVEIRKIYGIFSLGIHELKNDDCLAFFDVGKRSIIIVLEDDLKHQQELETRKQLASAIAKFSGEEKGESGP
jgi:hypothetical protein